jgi:hypothetical protein
MLVNIDSLRNTLPAVSAKTHLPHEAHEYRIRRLSPFAIISGVIGTLMGWFTQRLLNNLRDRLDEVQDQQHRLLHVQAVQLQRLEEINAAIHQLYSALGTRYTLATVSAMTISPALFRHAHAYGFARSSNLGHFSQHRLSIRRSVCRPPARLPSSQSGIHVRAKRSTETAPK